MWDEDKQSRLVYLNEIQDDPIFTVCEAQEFDMLRQELLMSMSHHYFQAMLDLYRGK